MASSGSGPSGDIFDVKRIRRLVELMNEHELSEIDLRQLDQRIRLRKGHDPIITTGPIQAAPGPAAPRAEGAPPAASAAPVDDKHIAFVKSPMVGTYYSSGSPETPAFIKVGDHVGPTTTVCIVEAMKVFNEIPAELSGQVVAVLVQNGDPVEFGQPLFKVDTRQ